MLSQWAVSIKSADKIFMLFGISDNYVLCVREERGRDSLAKGKEWGSKGVVLSIVK